MIKNDKSAIAQPASPSLKERDETPQRAKLISIFKALEMVLENFARRKRPAPFSEYGLHCYYSCIMSS